MAIASERRIASAPARRQGSARCARRLTPPLTATGAPAQRVVRQLLTQLLRSATTGFRNTKFLTTPEMVRDLMSETVEYRFGPAARGTPHPIEWLSDNGPCYTARETCEFARSLGLLVCTTPTYSTQSNGVAEAFVKTFKRDYVYVNQLPSADEVIAQLPGWFADYNEIHPHKGLGMRSPREYLREVS